MQAGGSAVPVLSAHSSVGTHTVDIDMHADSPLHRLAEGEEVFYKLRPKSILVDAMVSLGSNTEPLFSMVELSDGSFQCSVKLDVSHLKSASGSHAIFPRVQGQPSFSEDIAENNSALMAFRYLEDNHFIKIVDFSSRVVQRYESYHISELIAESFGFVEHFFSQWELTLSFCEKFSVKLEEMEFCNLIGEHLSERGKVFSVLNSTYSDIIMRLHSKSAELREAFNDFLTERAQLDEKVSLHTIVTPPTAPLRHVFLPSKSVLQHLLSYFGLPDAMYTSTPDNCGMSMTSIVLNFPYMEKHQFSGPIALNGSGETSIDSTEDAALEALYFIEKNFPVKVVDYNYSRRKKSLKYLMMQLELLNKLLKLSSKLRLLWCKLNNEIECNVDNFNLDPQFVFTGDFSDIQTEAYSICSKGLIDVQKYSLNALAACRPNIMSMQKIAWKLHVVKGNILL